MPHPLDLAHLGRLIGEPARARMLARLLDGRALTAGELAREARVTASTVSAHLRQLATGGLVTLEPRGRHRYVRLASAEAARALEALGVLVVSLDHGRRALVRRCVDGTRALRLTIEGERALRRELGLVWPRRLGAR